MPTYNLTQNLFTGEVMVIGKNGRRYTLDELEAAEAAARRGDPDAAATLIAVDMGRDEHGQPRELTDDDHHALMQQMMDDCPLCQEERARTGQEPVVVASGWTDATGQLVQVDDALRGWHGRRPKRTRRRHRGRR